MAKLFGEFLVERGIVSEDDLLGALIAQLRSVPSTAEVIYDNELLPNRDLLRVIAHQQHSGMDFRTSAAAVGCWSEDLAGLVGEIVRRARRPLGEVLIDQGSLTLEKLATALDSYVEACASESVVPPARSEVTASPQTETTHTETSVRRDANVEESLDPVLARDFAADFQARIGPALQSIIGKLGQASLGREALNAALSSAMSEFVSVTAALSSVGAIRSKLLADDLVETIEMLARNLGAFDPAILRDLVNWAFHVFDSISQLLADTCSEDLLEGDRNMKDLIERMSNCHVRLRAQVVSAERAA